MLNDFWILTRQPWIYRKLKKEGKLLPDADLLQASIAIANDLEFVTKNVKHFEIKKVWTQDLMLLIV